MQHELHELELHESHRVNVQHLLLEPGFLYFQCELDHVQSQLPNDNPEPNTKL